MKGLRKLFSGDLGLREEQGIAGLLKGYTRGVLRKSLSG